MVRSSSSTTWKPTVSIEASGEAARQLEKSQLEAKTNDDRVRGKRRQTSRASNYQIRYSQNKWLQRIELLDGTVIRTLD